MKCSIFFNKIKIKRVKNNLDSYRINYKICQLFNYFKKKIFLKIFVIIENNYSFTVSTGLKLAVKTIFF